MLVIHYSTPDSNPDSSFSGKADSFYIVNIVDQNNLVGQISEIYFQANTMIISLKVDNPDISFRSIKNITIENYKGEKKLINYSPYIQIKHYKKNHLLLSNGYFDFTLTNYTMTNFYEAFYNSINITGTLAMDDISSNGGKVSIDNFDYIIIGDEKLTNFKQIAFEMDKNGSIQFWPEISKAGAYPIEVSAYPISNLRIEGVFQRLTLNKGEGTLRIGNHQFDIKAADDLSIEVLPYTSKLSVNDTIVNFNGIASYSFLNNKDIIINDFSYWWEFQPEKINIFAILVAPLLPLLGYYLHYRSGKAKQKEKSRIAHSKLLYSSLQSFTNKLNLNTLPISSNTPTQRYSKEAESHLESGYLIESWEYKKERDRLVGIFNNIVQDFVKNITEKIKTEIGQRVSSLIEYDGKGKTPVKYFNPNYLSSDIGDIVLNSCNKHFDIDRYCIIQQAGTEPINEEYLKNVLADQYGIGRWKLAITHYFAESNNESEMLQVKQIVVAILKDALTGDHFTKIKKYYEDIKNNDELFANSVDDILKKIENDLPLKGKCDSCP